MTATGANIFKAVLAAIVIGVVAILYFGSKEDPYKVRILMDNADGLRDGSAVNMGGIPVGTVKLGIDKPTNKVAVTLQIKQQYAPIGKDATASIVAQNILGQKQVAVEKGDTAQPLEDHGTIDASKVAVTTDLDQVLDVLDAGTRARLAVLVNEAGLAVTGRKTDINVLLRDLPHSLQDATTLFNQIDADNHKLSDLLVTADGYVHATTEARQSLVHLVDRVGQTATTVATKRAELRATLATAPQFLRQARALLADLRTTAPPLGDAARRLSATAPPLQDALSTIEPFRQAAAPTLADATKIAPDLEKLAVKATPVLKRTKPALAQVDTLSSKTLPGVTKTLDGSIDNTLSVVENWARAIQFRDGMSHIFRAELSIAPDALHSTIARLQLPAKSKKTKQAQNLPDIKKTLDDTVKQPVDKVTKGLGGVLGNLDKTTAPVTDLLDSLLGK